VNFGLKTAKNRTKSSHPPTVGTALPYIQVNIFKNGVFCSNPL